jgi:hypothetical protein
VVPAKCVWAYPIGINKTNGLANIAEVERECPPLTPMTAMKSMKTSIDFEEGEITMLGKTQKLNGAI